MYKRKRLSVNTYQVEQKAILTSDSEGGYRRSMVGYVDAVHVVEQLRGLKDQPSIGHTYCTEKPGETSSRKKIWFERSLSYGARSLLLKSIRLPRLLLYIIIRAYLMNGIPPAEPAERCSHVISLA